MTVWRDNKSCDISNMARVEELKGRECDMYINSACKPHVVLSRASLYFSASAVQQDVGV